MPSNTIAIIQKPEVQRLLIISLLTGGIASATAAMIGPHIDPSLDTQKEIKIAIILGTATTLMSLGYKLYKAEIAN
jgi:hypothetical protein